ncbi:MAG: aryl-sulfate sulfotransferase [Gemmatimonadota bacterium]|nr:aryl-sulfate sulfotransferase [Gemmatimonadota bacterium]
MPRKLSLPLAMLIGGAACSSDAIAPTDALNRVAITNALVAPNPNNNLSALVKLATRNADSAWITYRAVPDAPQVNIGLETASPVFPVRGDTATIPALALQEKTPYSITVHVRGGRADTTAQLNFRAGPLPADLASLRLASTGTISPGFYLTDFTTPTSAYIVVFDESGRVCWYRQFATQPGEVAIDAEQESNGSYILFVGVSTGWQPTPGRFFAVNPAGDSIQTYFAKAPYYTDPHELLLEYNGQTLTHYDILGYEFRHVDLTALGGLPNQLVAGHLILRQSPSGAIEFAWNAWDHFTIGDWIFVQPGLAQMPSIDFDHPNSLIRDSDGNYVVSFASLGEITKIDASTGQIIWRFGGRNNQFALIGDPLDGFGIQHHVRVLANGDLLFIDNGAHHTPPESRAVEYKLDLNARTATLVWQYRHTPALFSPFAGSAQRFANGNTLVAFGAAAQLAEVTAGGQVMWEAQMQNAGVKVPFFYRALRIDSPYGAAGH